MHRVGFWMRLLAALLEAVLIYLILLSIRVGSFQIPIDEDLLMSVVWLIYTSSEAIVGAGPGKLMLGLRVGRADGVPSDRWRLFLRWSTKQFPTLCAVLFALTGLGLLYVIAGLLNTVLLIGFLYALNEDKQAWHDQWSGTAVYRRRDLYSTAPPVQA